MSLNAPACRRLRSISTSRTRQRCSRDRTNQGCGASESRAFPEIGRFYLKEVIGRGIPLLEGLIVRGIAQGEFRRVDPGMTVRSIMGAMLLAGLWRTVFEPIGAEKLDVRALARHHADLMLHALKPETTPERAGAS